MTNKIGKTLFSKAEEFGIPVGFMCLKVADFLSLDYRTDEENQAFLNLLELSRFPQVHVKSSALWRVLGSHFISGYSVLIVSSCLQIWRQSNHVGKAANLSSLEYKIHCHSYLCGYKAAKYAVCNCKGIKLIIIGVGLDVGRNCYEAFPKSLVFLLSEHVTCRLL